MGGRTCYCYQCNAPIQFIYKKCGGVIKVDTGRYNFIPTTQEQGEKFIASNGDIRYGTSASDGLLGFREHQCPYIKKKSA